MDLNTITFAAAAWLVVSVVVSLGIGGFIRQGNGALDEGNAANSTSSNKKVVSYLHRHRSKAAQSAEIGTTNSQRTAAPRRRAV